MSALGLREATLNIRISNQQKELIDQAAATTGKTRSAFMIESAIEAAQNAILDRSVFSLGPDEWATFMAALDAPPRPNEKLRRLMDSKAPWSKSSKA